jgi:hypothetical protein
MGKKSGSGSGMNEPDHISESLETIFGVKILEFLMRIRNPGWKKFRAGINIPDLQHCFLPWNDSWIGEGCLEQVGEDEYEEDRRHNRDSW